MDNCNYPALFRSADAASNRFQRKYLRLIVAEYGLLVLASVLSLSAFASKPTYIAAALVLGISAIVLLIRATTKPEQDWYKSRALAESVKTLTWRYAMAAYPFQDSDPAKARSEFKENLERTFRQNSEAAAKIAEDWAAELQITPEMDRLRGLSLQERREFYDKKRIQEQRSWYANKSAWNRSMARRWVAASVISYFFAAAFSLARIAYQQADVLPIDPMIVLATSMIGWVQIKKFNELAAAYAVTAQEIGLINITLLHSDDVNNFSEFVIEAETAFSREHTLWIARQAH